MKLLGRILFWAFIITGCAGLALFFLLGPAALVDDLMFRRYFADRPLLSAAAEDTAQGRQRLGTLLEGGDVEAKLVGDGFSCDSQTPGELRCYWSEAVSAPGLFVIVPMFVSLNVGLDERGLAGEIETQTSWTFL